MGFGSRHRSSFLNVFKPRRPAEKAAVLHSKKWGLQKRGAKKPGLEKRDQQQQGIAGGEVDASHATQSIQRANAADEGIDVGHCHGSEAGQPPVSSLNTSSEGSNNGDANSTAPWSGLDASTSLPVPTTLAGGDVAGGVAAQMHGGIPPVGCMPAAESDSKMTELPPDELLLKSLNEFKGGSAEANQLLRHAKQLLVGCRASLAEFYVPVMGFIERMETSEVLLQGQLLTDVMATYARDFERRYLCAVPAADASTALGVVDFLDAVVAPPAKGLSSRMMKWVAHEKFVTRAHALPKSPTLTPAAVGGQQGSSGIGAATPVAIRRVRLPRFKLGRALLGSSKKVDRQLVALMEASVHAAEGNMPLARLLMHTDTDSVTEQVSGWLADRFPFLARVKDPKRGQRAFAAAIVSGWQDGVGTPCGSSGSAAWRVLADVTRQIYDVRLAAIEGEAAELLQSPERSLEGLQRLKELAIGLQARFDRLQRELVVVSLGSDGGTVASTSEGTQAGTSEGAKAETTMLAKLQAMVVSRLELASLQKSVEVGQRPCLAECTTHALRPCCDDALLGFGLVFCVGVSRACCHCCCPALPHLPHPQIARATLCRGPRPGACSTDAPAPWCLPTHLGVCHACADRPAAPSPSIARPLQQPLAQERGQRMGELISQLLETTAQLKEHQARLDDMEHRMLANMLPEDEAAARALMASVHERCLELRFSLLASVFGEVAAGEVVPVSDENARWHQVKVPLPNAAGDVVRRCTLVALAMTEDGLLVSIRGAPDSQPGNISVVPPPSQLDGLDTLDQMDAKLGHLPVVLQGLAMAHTPEGKRASYARLYAYLLAQLNEPDASPANSSMPTSSVAAPLVLVPGGQAAVLPCEE
eukprot:jgi/Mesvir1/292/Mv13622-RA.2